MLTEEQKKRRQSGIGGSDAGTIAGVNPYMTSRELYEEKTGTIDPPDLSDNEAVHWGMVLEDEIAREYARRTGYKVRRINNSIQHPHLEFLIGHIDRDVSKTNRMLECKNVGLYSKGWGSGIDEVPEMYICQTQHYMMLRPKIEVCDLAVLIGGQQFRIYEIGRDDSLIQSLMQLECEFWERVLERRPPDFDFDHQSTADLLRKLYPGTNGATAHLPGEAQHWHEVLQDAKHYADKYKAVIDMARTHLMSLCQDNAISVLPDGTAYTRKIVKRKAYSVPESQYIDFRYSKKPKGIN